LAVFFAFAGFLERPLRRFPSVSGVMGLSYEKNDACASLCGNSGSLQAREEANHAVKGPAEDGNAYCYA
jgi:hypothetical protein